jgi:tetratricopeptide (TPR) repeat protein
MRAFEHAPRVIRAKGFDEPVTAYAVLRPLPRPEKVRGIEGLCAELIGREEEVAKIAESLRMVMSGRGCMVSIVGEAGVGKSRLVAELKGMALRESDGRDAPSWLEGRCLDVGMTVSYWPFLDLLREHFGWSVVEDERARGQRIGKSLLALAARGDLPRERVEEIGPLLGKLLSVRFGTTWDERLRDAGPEETKQQTFLAVRDLLVALSRRAPLLLVLEDLHWADNFSLDLIALVMETLTLAPILLVCVYRPEQQHPCWHLGTIARRKCLDRFTEIVLHELSTQQSQRMVESLLRIDTLPASVKEQILAKAQGNPFFVEEVIRSLIDSGALYKDAEGWRTRGEVLDIAVPESLQSVILSRVDQLEAEIRHVLQSAAVIGPLFRRRLVGQITRQAGELDKALGDLEDRALIYRERVVPEEEYSFRHVLTQDIVYHNILTRRRTQIHRQVAEAIEKLYQDGLEEYYEQLAYHFDRGNHTGKAIEYCFKSGEKARQLYANEAAVGHFTRGLELLRAAPTSANSEARELDFILALGVPLVLSRGHYAPEVEAAYRRAREIGSRVGTTEQRFQVTLGLRRSYWSRGKLRPAQELDQELIDLGQRAGDAMLTSRGHMMASETLLFLGDSAAAIEHAQAGLKLYDPKDCQQHLVRFGNDTHVGCLLCLAQAEWLRGRCDRAQEAARSGVERAREIGHAFTMVFALYNRGLVAHMRREPDQAIQESEEVVAIARRERFPLYLAMGSAILGWALGMRGEGARGVELIRDGLETLPAGMPGRDHFVVMLAEVCLKERMIPEAASAIDERLSVADDSESLCWSPELKRLRGEIGLLAGEPEAAAEGLFLQSLDAARRMGARAFELRSALSLFRLRGCPQEGEAREWLEAACAGFTQGNESADLAEARQALAEAPG